MNTFEYSVSIFTWAEDDGQFLFIFIYFYKLLVLSFHLKLTYLGASYEMITFLTFP